MSETFGAEITRRRARLGLTSDGMAHELEVSANTYHHWERERHSPSRVVRAGTRAVFAELERALVADILAEQGRVK